MHKIISNSPMETEKFGRLVGRLLSEGDVVCLIGDLGVGKTAFVKGMALGMGIHEHITSPTFTIVNEYRADKNLYHFDVYRIDDPDDLYEIGFDEYIFGDGISIIEWADMIEEVLPEAKLWVEIQKDFDKGEDYREIILKPYGEKYVDLVEQLIMTWSEDNEGSGN